MTTHPWQVAMAACLARYVAAPDDVAVQDEVLATAKELMATFRGSGATLPPDLHVLMPLLHARGLLARATHRRAIRMTGDPLEPVRTELVADLPDERIPENRLTVVRSAGHRQGLLSVTGYTAPFSPLGIVANTTTLFLSADSCRILIRVLQETVDAEDERVRAETLEEPPGTVEPPAP